MLVELSVEDIYLIVASIQTDINEQYTSGFVNEDDVAKQNLLIDRLDLLLAE